MRIIIELDDQLLPVRGASSSTGGLTGGLNETAGLDAEMDGGGPAPQLLDELGSLAPVTSGLGQGAEDTGPPPGWLLAAIEAAELNTQDYFASNGQPGDAVEIENGGGAPPSADH